MEIRPLKQFKFLAALLLLALPFSRPAHADLCMDPTTHGYVTCPAAPASGTGGYYEQTTIASPNSLSVAFDVATYGAKCDGSTDDTTAINNTFAAALAQYNTGTFNSAVVRFPAHANCKTTGTINATGFTNEGKTLTVEGNGATVYLNANTAVPVWDMLGSSNNHYKDLILYASSGFQTYGLQTGRINTATNAGRQNTFEHLNISGSYTQAACYNFAGEDDIWTDIFCQNTNATSGWGLVFDGENHFNITSAFVTQTLAADTEASFNGNTVIGGKFSSTASAYTPIWLEGTTGHHFINAYTYNAVSASNTGSCYTLYNVAAVAPYGNNKGLHLWGSHCEANGNPQFYILMDGPGSGGPHFTASPTLVDLEISEPYLATTDVIFHRVVAAGISSTVYEDLHLDIAGGSASGSARVFGGVTTQTVSGYVHTYKANLWDGPTFGITLDVAGKLAYGGPGVLAQWGVPVILPPSGYFQNNGLYIIGQLPANSATLSVSATSGSVTATFSAATLLGTASDVGRVITICDGTCSASASTKAVAANYKYCTITAQSSTTVATCTESGGALASTGAFSNANVWISGASAGTANYSTPLPNLAACSATTGCYMYFPSGAIVAAGAAGTYYVQCTAVAVCTAYNNVLSSGAPVTISSPTAFSTTGPGAFTQTTNTELALVTIPIAAGSIGPNGTLVFDSSAQRIANTDTVNEQLTIGGTAIAIITVAGSNQWYGMHRTFQNMGSASSQAVTNPSISNATDTVVNASAVTYTSIDTSAAQNLVINGDLVTAATDFFILFGATVQINGAL